MLQRASRDRVHGLFVPSHPTQKMNEVEMWNTALLIALEDLEEPNPETRRIVSDQDVWAEFWAIRDELIRHAQTLYKSAQ